MRGLLRRAWYFLRQHRLDDELAEEMEFHRAMAQREIENRGVDARDAGFAARRAFGSAALAADRSRDVWVPRALQGLGQDFRLAVRTMFANRLVSFVAIVSLALGIGANTAIFSLVNSLMLRALPVKDPAQLVLVKGREPTGYPEWSYPLFEQLRQRPELFDGIVAWSPTARATVTAGAESQHVDGLLASGSFFDVLGVRAAIGRTFAETDDVRGGGPDGPVAVISHDFWQRQFGGAADAIGRTLTVENVPLTIIGVTPPDFFGPDVGRMFDLIVPLGVEPLLSRSEARLDNRDATSWLNIMARLKPGQARDAATAGLRGVQAQMFDATVPEHWDARSRDEYRHESMTLLPALTGDSTVRQLYARPLTTILVVVVLVLLIACANLANLLLARATARRHELSVRTALGASRWRLVRQQLAESAVLAGAGAAGGIVMASWASRVIVRQLSTDAKPVFLDLSMDWHVLAFTIGIAIATALLFGVAPALQASGVAPMDALKARGDRSGPAERRRVGFSSGLVVAQVALSVVLLVAAGLFVRTFTSLVTRHLGFERDRVLVVSVNAHSAAIDPSRRIAMYEQAREAVGALPGVAAAAVSTLTPPVDGPMSILPLADVGGRQPEGERPHATINAVSPDWFATFGTPIVAGRDFSTLDRSGAPRVAIVNRAFIRKFLAGLNPVGQSFTPKLPPPRDASPVTIVGVAEDAVLWSLRSPIEPAIYVPIAQGFLPAPWLAQVHLSVRSTNGPPARLARSIGSAVSAVNRELALTFQPLADQVDASLTQERVVAQLSGFFGALALLLAGLGLYGVTAYAVSRRRREIGIRVALGAAPAGVVRLVLSRVTMLVGLGVVIGTGVSLWASRYVASLLYGLQPRDPATLSGAVVVLAVVGGLAAWLPARRASRIDPAVVLRCE
ncbi:MAG: ABC transporter permease [Acidobacteriia bacterium]|nr:ABC transporter permease [Terriglobia bacterium]